MIDLNELTEKERAAVAAVQEEAKRLAAEYGPDPDYTQLAEGSRRLRDFTRPAEVPWIGPNGLVLDAAVPPLEGDELPVWGCLLAGAAGDAWNALSTAEKVGSLTGTVRHLEGLTKAAVARLGEVESRVAAIEAKVQAAERRRA